MTLEEVILPTVLVRPPNGRPWRTLLTVQNNTLSYLVVDCTLSIRERLRRTVGLVIHIFATKCAIADGG